MYQYLLDLVLRRKNEEGKNFERENEEIANKKCKYEEWEVIIRRKKNKLQTKKLDQIYKRVIGLVVFYYLCKFTWRVYI